MAAGYDHQAAKMKRLHSFLAILIILLIEVVGPWLRQPLAASGPPLTVYVDGTDPRASEANSGSKQAPVKTIQNALDRAARALAHGSSVRIRVGPGTYREALTIAGLNNPNGPPLMLEASVAGQTIVSGSDVWTGWSSDGGRLLVHAWPFDWGVSPNPRGWPELQTIVRRREMVFVNGTPLQQSLILPLSKPGTFAVSGNTIVLYPLTNIDPQSATIEVAVRPVLLKSQGHANNLTIRGIVFQHANTAAGYGINASVVLAGSNITLENCNFNWNNWVGLSVATTDHITLTNCTADNNGENGISMWRVSHLEAINLSTSNDNWRGAAGNFLGWDADGFKALSLHDATFQRFHALSNQSGGMWLDTDNANIVIRNATVAHNLTNGFFFEKIQGPVLVSNSTIARNHDSGVQGSYSTNISLVNDVICGNDNTQLRIAGLDGAQNISDHWTGQQYQLRSARWTIDNSRIIAINDGQELVSTYLNNSWADFADTLTSRNNLWAEATTLHLSASAQRRDRDPRTWLSATGKDTKSRFEGLMPGSCPE
jgi:hypothetical protein